MPSLDLIKDYAPLITASTAVFALIFGAANIYMLRKTEQNKNDEMLFEFCITNLDNAIRLLESLKDERKNDSNTWTIASEQISCFHNLIINIKHQSLRQCYCAKLNLFISRIRNILTRIDDFRFFYGKSDYHNKSALDLLRESYDNFTHISTNTVGILLHFLLLFDGAKGDYMENSIQVNKILRPVYPFFDDDPQYSDNEIDQLPHPFNHLHRYIRQTGENTRKLYVEKYPDKARARGFLP